MKEIHASCMLFPLCMHNLVVTYLQADKNGINQQIRISVFTAQTTKIVIVQSHITYRPR